jgi:DNA-binding MarR family transcriptional regulator
VLARDLLHVTMRMMHSIATTMRRAPEASVPGQMATLFKLSMQPATMSELARYRGISVPTVSKSVDVLEQRGWVERWVDPADRRQTLVRLTRDGRRVAAAMKTQSERHVASLLSPLTADQRTQLVNALSALKDILPAAP